MSNLFIINNLLFSLNDTHTCWPIFSSFLKNEAHVYVCSDSCIQIHTIPSFRFETLRTLIILLRERQSG